MIINGIDTLLNGTKTQAMRGRKLRLFSDPLKAMSADAV